MSSAPFNITGANGMPGNPMPPTMMSSSPGVTAGPGNFNFGNTQNPTAPQTPTTPASGNGPYSYTPPPTPVPSGVNNSIAQPGAPPTLNPGTTPTSTVPVVAPGSSAAGELGNIYGSGGASIVSGFLNSEGGYNSALTNQTVAAQSAAAQQQITLGENNLKENLAASGISPNSSVAALEESNYMAQATTQENAIAAQEYFNMWGESDQLQAGMIGQVAQNSATYKANSNNWWESLLGDAIDVGSIVAAPFTGGLSLGGLGLGQAIKGGGGGSGAAIPGSYGGTGPG
jgi:hypothetical protein